MTRRKPVVALIGRPNVGKSTLFNRLIGRRVAIVHDRPGVTRDRHYGDAYSLGLSYTLIDTGGFDPSGDDDMKKGIVSQIEVALSEADVILCVLDATSPPTSIDSDEMMLLRRSDRPVIYLANKSDSDRQEAEANELYRLGMDRLVFISALHGRGMVDLEEALVAALRDALGPEVDEPDQPEESDAGCPRIAVVGRPNAGKSSLINRLLGETRLLVDSRPGTTRDPIDSLVQRGDKRYRFVDTAGLRRKAKVAKGRDAVEAASVVSAVRSMDRAEIVVLMCDAQEGVAEQDAKILGLALDRGRGVVIGLNKIDLLNREERKEALLNARDVLSFVPWAPIVEISSLKGRGVDRLLQTIERVRESYFKRVSTGQLNRFFDTVLSAHPPPIQGGRAPRFYYVTQAGSRPPTFMVVTSHPDNLHFSYQRYVSNSIRKAFEFEGVPVRVVYRRKDRRPKNRRRGGTGRG